MGCGQKGYGMGRVGGVWVEGVGCGQSSWGVGRVVGV